MLIHRKFDYRPLERIDAPDGRRYIVGEGSPLPSVTTILSATADMTFINEWSERVGEHTAERIRNESSELGSAMHKNIENYVMNIGMSGSFMAKALANTIIKNGMSKVDEVWGSEIQLYSENLYAGTTDLVGVFNGKSAIIDFKNSRAEKNKEWISSYFCQLAAYAMSHDEMFGTNIECGVVMIATRDARYQEFVIEGDEFEFYKLEWANKLCAYYDMVKSD